MTAPAARKRSPQFVLPEGREPHTRFHIRPDGPFLYAVVRVWESRAALLRHRRASGMRGACEAYCVGLDVYAVRPSGRTRRTGQFAEVNFYRRAITQGIVTHEMFHATLAWGRRVGIAWAALGESMDGAGPVSDVEERLAYVHGALCSEFVRTAHELGLYDTAEGDPCR